MDGEIQELISGIMRAPPEEMSPDEHFEFAEYWSDRAQKMDNDNLDQDDIERCLRHAQIEAILGIGKAIKHLSKQMDTVTDYLEKILNPD